MSKLTLVVFFLIIGASVFAQTSDAKSKTILTKTSEINNGYKTIIMDFSFTSTDIQTNKVITSEKGSLVLKGEKYKLIIDKTNIIFDGKSIYHFNPESNEVNITNPEPARTEKGDFFISNPRDVFKFYTKNFKTKWIKESQVKGTICNEIELYPIDLKTKYTKITMHIDKSTYHILDIKLAFKDGTRQMVEFTNFKDNTDIADSEFVFDQNKYKGIVINDMRF